MPIVKSDNDVPQDDKAAKIIARAILAAALIEKSGLSAFYLTSGQVNPSAITRIQILVEVLNEAPRE